ncbi:imidazole glycerol phosphate synthase subunit HisH [Leptotrichia buccalis]|uniref:Imidazole glycerol phosphate synthase subunit HisH n=1 Tax=Leptotrichia buccalis (strain ATCC 14201 / DSM 1135 / JCM 12969 / NCTC 10249 / C-1013-b) TaxID=523794 RepID=C7NAD8_LEPBD|nr:imidazole glycerol phosphate synthase subunit HisH [Leptotrichia buccalis]ACV39119.1 imidazole glycerol phosphate synthase, glutamine amidotransferase subunit [Leptotrichia buccalis C-1013-b]
MIAVIDYGVGNLFSLLSSLNYVGLNTKLTNDIEEIKNAKGIILPGVGAFRDAIGNLEKYGLKETLISEAKKGKPFLGICLGMQMLFEKSYEYGEYEGLGLINGTVEEIKKYIPENFDLKIPHMGWNSLIINERFKDDKILKDVDNNEYVYYVHSYFAKTDMKNIVTYSEYGTKIPGIVKNENVYGMQFHPEKSGDTGLKLLKNWGELVK